MTGLETSLENRVLALEARVQALEKMAADLPGKTKQVKAWAKDISASHVDLLSLIEDHIEVLKLIHSTVGPIDRKKNKLILGYIRRAEFKLGQFQARFVLLEELQKCLANGAPEKLPALPAKPRGASVPSPLNRLLRSVSRWNM